jgi:hypothetical protein
MNPEPFDPPAIIQPAATLADLAKQINAEHKLCAKALRAGLQHALTAGRLLIEAKEKVPHGRWIPWLQEHCDFALRTAQAYMKAARDVPQLDKAKAQRVALLPFRDAMRELAENIEAKSAKGRDARKDDVCAKEAEAAREMLGLHEDKLVRLMERRCTIPTAMETGWATDGKFLTRLSEEEQASLKQVPFAYGRPMDVENIEAIIPQADDFLPLRVVGRFRVSSDSFSFDVGPGLYAFRPCDGRDLLVLADSVRFDTIRTRYPDAELGLASRSGVKTIAFRAGGETVALLTVVGQNPEPWSSVSMLLTHLSEQVSQLRDFCEKVTCAKDNAEKPDREKDRQLHAALRTVSRLEDALKDIKAHAI